MLSEKAKENKKKYNTKRKKELYKKFGIDLKKDEYQEICEYLKSQGMNKAEFIRWAYDKLREGD